MTTYSARTLCFADAILAGNSHIPQNQLASLLRATQGACGRPLPEDVRNLEQLSAEVDGLPESQHFLERGDLFRVLSEGRYSQISSTATSLSQSNVNPRAILRRALDLPLQDSSDLRLSFQSFPLEKGGQVATTRFEPSNIDPQSRPLVFFTGVARRSAVYFSLLSDIARRDHRVVIAVDHPHVGGSVGGGNQPVTSTLLLASARTALTSLFPQGSSFDILAHSLGTVVARHIYMNPHWIDGRKIQRMVLVAPPPTFIESLMGHHFDLVVGIFNFLDRQQYTSPATQQWVSAIVHEERNHYDARSIIGWINEETGFLARLSTNTDLRYVFPLEDQLFPLRSPENWQQSNVFQMAHASHSSLLFRAPQEEGGFDFDRVRHALNTNFPNPIPQRTLHTEAAIPLSFRFLGALCDLFGIS